MGLDMFLFKRVKGSKAEGRDEVAYWRKSNHIHKWFSDHVAKGELENCQEYVVTKEDLENLLITVDCVMKDPESAPKTLPTQDGFFFGSTDYDEGYIDDLKHTHNVVEEILRNTDFENEEIVYLAWW